MSGHKLKPPFVIVFFSRPFALAETRPFLSRNQPRDSTPPTIHVERARKGEVAQGGTFACVIVMLLDQPAFRGGGHTDRCTAAELRLEGIHIRYRCVSLETYTRCSSILSPLVLLKVSCRPAKEARSSARSNHTTERQCCCRRTAKNARQQGRSTNKVGQPTSRNSSGSTTGKSRLDFTAIRGTDRDAVIFEALSAGTASNPTAR